MPFNSISHIVCKFQRDWMKNKKNAKFGESPVHIHFIYMQLVGKNPELFAECTVLR